MTQVCTFFCGPQFNLRNSPDQRFISLLSIWDHLLRNYFNNDGLRMLF